MLQGTLALQFGFRTAGRNPEALEQQLRDTKYTPPAICQQNANTTVSGKVCNGISKNTNYSENGPVIVFFTTFPITGIQVPPWHRIASCCAASCQIDEQNPPFTSAIIE